MATMTETAESLSTITPSHEYHAHAQVFSGHIHRPFEQKIESQAPVKLSDRRGGYFDRQVTDFGVEGFVSFTKGQTRVSGARSMKSKGWVTLSTSTIQSMNVFEIITADRIVAQISTEHPYENGHVPHVTFLGTQFKNLQVSGFPVELKLNLGFFGDRPAEDRLYLHDRTFLDRVEKQTAAIASADCLPKALKEQYDERLHDIQQLIEISDASEDVPRKPITCSLVESIGPIPIPGVQSFGHVLVIPEFGTVSLGEVEVGEKLYDSSDRPCVYFEFRSIQMNMGCVADGPLNGPTVGGNGNTRP